MKTIAEQLNIKEFPFKIKDKDGNLIYYEESNGYSWKKEYKDGQEVYFENSNGYWCKREYKDGEEIYYENSKGVIQDDRQKERPCIGKKVIIEGIEYELK